MLIIGFFLNSYRLGIFLTDSNDLINWSKKRIPYSFFPYNLNLLIILTFVNIMTVYRRKILFLSFFRVPIFRKPMFKVSQFWKKKFLDSIYKSYLHIFSSEMRWNIDNISIFIIFILLFIARNKYYIGKIKRDFMKAGGGGGTDPRNVIFYHKRKRPKAVEKLRKNYSKKKNL